MARNVPLTEVAEIDVVRGYSEINRLDQKRSITVSADVDEAEGQCATDCESPPGRFHARNLLVQYPERAGPLGRPAGANSGKHAKPDDCLCRCPDWSCLCC